MPQRTVVDSTGHVTVIETGPAGPAGPSGVPDPEGLAEAIEEALDVAGLVTTGDARLTNTRTPTDESVTAAKIAPSLRDPAANVPGTRTLGTSAIQAAPGTIVPRVVALETTIETKEDEGVAAAVVNALPETVDSDTIAVDDTSAPGFVSFHSKAHRLPANPTTSFGSNSTAENNMLASALVLPANYFDMTHMYEFEFSGTIAATTGTPTCTIRVKFGGTTFYSFVYTPAVNALLRRFRCRGLFGLYSFSGTRLAGNAQMTLSAPGNNGAGGLDLGSITAAAEVATIDPAVANAVTITQQWSAAHAGSVCVLYPGLIRRIRA